MRGRARALALVAATVALACAACGAPAPLAGPRLSLLAVGDWGAEPERADRYATLLDVAAGMAASDAAAPVDALVLLGDNFYPDGLREVELVPRVRANLARPWCRFLATSGPRFGEIADACALPDAERHAVPLYAVLGNHDRRTRESPRLQRETLPLFVANWVLAPEPAHAVELGEGVSLVVFDSSPAFAGARSAEADLAALTEALRAARGPWRVLAAHHPPAGAGGDAEDRAHYARYRRGVVAAVEAAGVPVQLVLAGHEHNLQLLAMAPPAPALHVISGAAASTRGVHDENPRRLAARAHTPGYARVDLVGEGDSARLVASLHARRRGPARLLGAETLVARLAVSRDGRVEPWREGSE